MPGVGRPGDGGPAHTSRTAVALALTLALTGCALVFGPDAATASAAPLQVEGEVLNVVATRIHPVATVIAEDARETHVELAKQQRLFR